MMFIVRGVTGSQNRPRSAVALAALFAMLAVLWVGAISVPSASAQTPFYPFNYGAYNYGNPYAGYGYGYNNGCLYTCYGNNGYLLNNYGFNSGYNYGNYGYNYSNPYSYYGNNSYGTPGGCLLTCYGSNYYGYNTTAGASQGYATARTTSSAGTAASTGRTYNYSGRYCTDSSGGQVWVASGGTTSGLTC